MTKTDLMQISGLEVYALDVSYNIPQMHPFPKIFLIFRSKVGNIVNLEHLEHLISISNLDTFKYKNK